MNITLKHFHPKIQIEQWKIRKANHYRRMKFSLGEQDHTDFISYEGLKEETDHLVIDGTYLRTLFISGYPYIASSGWLNAVINFNHNADVSYHIEQVDAQAALPKLHRKITELESMKRSMLRSGKIINSEITDPLESAIKLRDRIQRGQEKLFQVSIYVALMTRSYAELNEVTTLLETVLASRLFLYKNS